MRSQGDAREEHIGQGISADGCGRQQRRRGEDIAADWWLTSWEWAAAGWSNIWRRHRAISDSRGERWNSSQYRDCRDCRNGWHNGNCRVDSW
jgi:hypothetical protein